MHPCCGNRLRRRFPLPSSTARACRIQPSDHTSEVSYRLDLQRFRMLLLVVHDLTHFERRDGRRQSQEEEECQRKESQRSYECRYIPACWDVYTPRGWQEVTMQADDHDDEPFQPHADQDVHRNEEQGRNALTHTREPKQLRDDNVARDQAPV